MVHEASNVTATSATHRSLNCDSDLEMNLIRAKQAATGQSSEPHSIPAPKVWRRNLKKAASASGNASTVPQFLENCTQMQSVQPIVMDEWSRDFLFLAELNE